MIDDLRELAEQIALHIESDRAVCVCYEPGDRTYYEMIFGRFYGDATLNGPARYNGRNQLMVTVMGHGSYVFDIGSDTHWTYVEQWLWPGLTQTSAQLLADLINAVTAALRHG